jgi:hypothetical protein
MNKIARGHTAVMAQRREPPDALDYFPTPLWASRAFFHHVLPALGIETIDRVWEPACGEGHMAAVIAEFARKRVLASDTFDYGYGTAPHDFLHDDPLIRPDWVSRIHPSISPAISRSTPLNSPAKASPCWCVRNGSRASGDTRSFSVIVPQSFTRRSSSACRW